MKLHPPEDVGLSPARLKRIDTVMEDFVADNRLPGIITLIQRRGKIAHLGKYGLMDIEAGRPIQEDAIFRIYSMTKPIISVALMMLYEAGRLSLQDPVSTFIPAFGQTKVYAGTTPLGLKLVEQDPVMTVYHLLTHTAGLSYGWAFDSPVEELYRELTPNIFHREQSLEYVVEQIAQLPLLFQPGSQWRYSRATDILGYIVQVLADMPLADFLEERIFRPLGMSDTTFQLPPEKLDRLAQIYESPGLYDPIVVDPASLGTLRDVTTPTRCPSGGGGLFSTMADYLSFCNCLLNEGRFDGGQLISRKTLEWMTANHISQRMLPLTMGPVMLDYGFGLGFRVTTSLGEARALTSVGEYGWFGIANTYFWIDRTEALIGLMMTQHRPMLPYPVWERFKILAYQSIDD